MRSRTHLQYNHSKVIPNQRTTQFTTRVMSRVPSHTSHRKRAQVTHTVTKSGPLLRSVRRVALRNGTISRTSTPPVFSRGVKRRSRSQMTPLHPQRQKIRRHRTFLTTRTLRSINGQSRHPRLRRLHTRQGSFIYTQTHIHTAVQT